VALVIDTHASPNLKIKQQKTEHSLFTVILPFNNMSLR